MGGGGGGGGGSFVCMLGNVVTVVATNGADIVLTLCFLLFHLSTTVAYLQNGIPIVADKDGNAVGSFMDTTVRLFKIFFISLPMIRMQSTYLLIKSFSLFWYFCVQKHF